MVLLLDCQDCYCVRPLDCVLDLGEGEQEATSFTLLVCPFKSSISDILLLKTRAPQWFVALVSHGNKLYLASMTLLWRHHGLQATRSRGATFRALPIPY